ncbi:MAG: protein-L-isoaspartate(D-aspartate) O-methyltransferase [Candidatus Krumholzibacteria bacterium]|nr:protein-L-isoaspartate(D-aspartate) O-methyltransferase [Candidatus Krumholzibacteria bacterium]
MAAAVDYRIARKRMVEEQLRSRKIADDRVLGAFLDIPRHLFVDPAVRVRAYEDNSFPIGYEQTISQPYTIAFMLQSLEIESRHRVLEIGTGSGYQSALLSLLAREVYTIELITPLARKAEETLRKVKTGKIRLKAGDGSEGWRGYAPFDRIIVAAVMRERPLALLDQLCDGGKLIAPLAAGTEYLVLYSRENGHIQEKRLQKCAFVPLRKGMAK